MVTPHSQSTVFRVCLVALFVGIFCVGRPAVGVCQDNPPAKPKTPPPAKPKTPPTNKPPQSQPKANPKANPKAAQDAAKAKKDAEKAKRDAEKAKERAALEEVKFKQAELLREAYVLAAAANHDYAGHRAKAMGHMQSAVKLLEAGLAKNGSAKTKAMTRYEDATAGRNIGRRAAVHEAQLVSDVQMKKAAFLLEKSLPEISKLDEKNVHQHVDHAIKEIAIALTKN